MDADLIIGAVLIPGRLRLLVSRDLVSKLQKGSVMVDVAIDQGGCFETSRATSYQDPTYEVTVLFITVWLTCRVVWLEPRHWRSRMQRRSTWCAWPIKGWCTRGDGDLRLA